jgi:hypothetical protein
VRLRGDDAGRCGFGRADQLEHHAMSGIEQRGDLLIAAARENIEAKKGHCSGSPARAPGRGQGLIKRAIKLSANLLDDGVVDTLVSVAIPCPPVWSSTARLNLAGNNNRCAITSRLSDEIATQSTHQVFENF